MSKKVFPYKILPVLPTQLQTDLSYQREINNNHVKSIIKFFDENCVEFPRVSLRSDGKYYVIDGDHTAQVWFEKFGNKPIQCIVYSGMTVEDEAELFLTINRARSHKALAATERLSTMLNMHDPMISDMADAAKMCGVELNFKGGGGVNGRCNAPDALFKVYKTYGREIMMDVLTVIMKTWDGQYESLYSGFLQGLALFFKRYNGKFDCRNLVKSLKRNAPAYYIQQAKLVSGNIGTRYCRVFLTAYNLNRSSNRIEDNL